MRRPPYLSRPTLITFAGLLVGILGLVIQWIAVPAKFAGAEGTFGISFPPGIAILLAFGLLTLFTVRWWWHPVFAVLISFWIAGAGTMAGKTGPNLTSHNVGTVAGTAIMIIGLVASFVAGIVSMRTGLRIRKAIRTSSAPPSAA
jgi:hypothetical protein